MEANRNTHDVAKTLLHEATVQYHAGCEYRDKLIAGRASKAVIAIVNDIVDLSAADLAVATKRAETSATNKSKTDRPDTTFLKAVGKLRCNLSVLQAASAECCTNAEEFSAAWDHLNDVQGVSNYLMAEAVLTKIQLSSCEFALRNAQIALEKVYEK